MFHVFQSVPNHLMHSNLHIWDPDKKFTVSNTPAYFSKIWNTEENVLWHWPLKCCLEYLDKASFDVIVKYSIIGKLDFGKLCLYDLIFSSGNLAEIFSCVTCILKWQKVLKPYQFMQTWDWDKIFNSQIHQLTPVKYKIQKKMFYDIGH